MLSFRAPYSSGATGTSFTGGLDFGAGVASSSGATKSTFGGGVAAVGCGAAIGAGIGKGAAGGLAATVGSGVGAGAAALAGSAGKDKGLLGVVALGKAGGGGGAVVTGAGLEGVTGASALGVSGWERLAITGFGFRGAFALGAGFDFGLIIFGEPPSPGVTTSGSLSGPDGASRALRWLGRGGSGTSARGTRVTLAGGAIRWVSG